MQKEKTIPSRLYKYRSFNDKALDALVRDSVFYASPEEFNDPLDSQPTVCIDLAESDLVVLLRALIEERTKAESQSRMDTLSKEEETQDDVLAQTRLRAEIDPVLERLEFGFVYSDDEEGQRRYLLQHQIEHELRLMHSAGIVSLSEHVSCPLMWSHYGDEHRGLCVGYSVPHSPECKVHRVEYAESRTVKASTILNMLTGDDGERMEAQEQVYSVALLRKEVRWSYEKEWRIIGSRGLRESPLDLREVTFGMRCKDSIKYSVIKALEGRDRALKFYEMRALPGKFELERNVLGCEHQLFSYFPRRARSTRELFKPVSSGEDAASGVEK